MSDLSYREAELTAFRRQAESLGADYSIDVGARAVLSDQLVFLRNNPAHIDDPVALENGEFTAMIGWACDDEAAIILGRLAKRGWKLSTSSSKDTA